MAIFAGLLLILELIWSRASLVVFAVSFNTLALDRRRPAGRPAASGKPPLPAELCRGRRGLRRADLRHQRDLDPDDPGPAGRRGDGGPDQPARLRRQPGRDAAVGRADHAAGGRL